MLINPSFMSEELNSIAVNTARTRQNNKKIVPIVTWSPWNPVVTKKVVPKTLSFQWKVIPYLYSIIWQNKNTVPKRTVTNKCLAKKRDSVRFTYLKRARCAKVIATPEDNNKIVLTKGNPQTSKDWILFGGQMLPTEIDGDKLTWKKAQKNAKKNITSDTINRAIPNLNPWRTTHVWCPWPDSLTTIKNHENKTAEKLIQPTWKKKLS